MCVSVSWSLMASTVSLFYGLMLPNIHRFVIPWPHRLSWPHTVVQLSVCSCQCAVVWLVDPLNCFCSSSRRRITSFHTLDSLGFFLVSSRSGFFLSFTSSKFGTNDPLHSEEFRYHLHTQKTSAPLLVSTYGCHFARSSRLLFKHTHATCDTPYLI